MELIIIKKDDEIAFCNSTSDYGWQYDIDSVYKTYERSKDLYVPQEFLHDIIKRISSSFGPIILKYSLDEILKTSKSNWRHYQKFKNDVSKFDPFHFHFFIMYYTSPWESTRSTLKRLKFNDSTIDDIKKQIDAETSAFCLQNKEDPNLGCFVVINGEIIDRKDSITLGQKLDHELNHWFVES